MAGDPKAAALALHRFGCGPRAGSIAKIAGDPKGAMLADLERPKAGQIAPSKELMSSAAMARSIVSSRSDTAAMAPAPAKSPAPVRNTAQKPMAMAMGNDAMGGAAMAKTDVPQPKNAPPRSPALNMLINEVKANTGAAYTADVGFVERLVWFWSNHFCISTEKLGPVAGSYEREAIRPYVLGSFADMLTAVETHPGMLLYLDNAESIGPNSLMGKTEGKGLNENLAREIMELHTLGVRSGYTQEDVTNLAKIITGWTLVTFSDRRNGGSFVFLPEAHEPGAQTVLGKSYPDTGANQGRAVLADLARHPATAQHIAFKFARHFVADDPPQPLVDRLAANFLETGGNLKEFAKTLIDSPEAWSEDRVKIKPPNEVVIAAVRATGVEPVPEGVMRAVSVLGRPMWRPGGPNGFPDVNDAWIDGLPQRLDVAADYAARVADKLDPIALIDVTLGPLSSDDTRETVKFAGSRQQALTMLLMAPEFNRR